MWTTEGQLVPSLVADPCKEPTRLYDVFMEPLKGRPQG